MLMQPKNATLVYVLLLALSSLICIGGFQLNRQQTWQRFGTFSYIALKDVVLDEAAEATIAPLLGGQLTVAYDAAQEVGYVDDPSLLMQQRAVLAGRSLSEHDANQAVLLLGSGEQLATGWLESDQRIALNGRHYQVVGLYLKNFFLSDSASYRYIVPWSHRPLSGTYDVYFVGADEAQTKRIIQALGHYPQLSHQVADAADVPLRWPTIVWRPFQVYVALAMVSLAIILLGLWRWNDYLSQQTTLRIYQLYVTWPQFVRRHLQQRAVLYQILWTVVTGVVVAFVTNWLYASVLAIVVFVANTAVDLSLLAGVWKQVKHHG